MPVSRGRFPSGILVQNAGSSKELDHRSVQFLETGARSGHFCRYDDVPPRPRRQHANRLPQAAAQTVANDSPAKALSGHEAVAVVFQPVDEASQDQQLVLPPPPPLEDGVKVRSTTQPKLSVH